MAELRHPNEIVKEQEAADYLKNLDKINKARAAIHPSKAAMLEEQAAKERAVRSEARAETRAAHALATPAPATPVASEPPKPEPKDGE